NKVNKTSFHSSGEEHSVCALDEIYKPIAGASNNRVIGFACICNPAPATTVHKVSTDNHPCIIKLESLSRINTSNLIHTTRIVRPHVRGRNISSEVPGIRFSIPGSAEPTNNNIFDKASVAIRC